MTLTLLVPGVGMGGGDAAAVEAIGRNAPAGTAGAGGTRGSVGTAGRVV